MSRTLILSVSLALGFAACTTGPRQGDECQTSNACGTTLFCNRCNFPADAGVDDSGAMPYAPCDRPCTSNADCTGASDRFGSTPRCVTDTCGNHFCGIAL